AEYIATAKAAMEAIWIRKFISGLGVVPSIDKPMDMYCDNTGAITIADELGVQKGVKHFRQKYHFIRQVIQEGDIRIPKVHTDNNLADPLTKPMPCTKHVEHASSVMLVALDLDQLELGAEFFGAGAKLMGLQLLQPELRLRKTLFRSFRPIKSAKILWQSWASSSFGVSLAHDGSWSKWEPYLWLCG
ncbi:hypothetical protein Tco_1388782, partial [Tanacetum coccineum]